MIVLPEISVLERYKWKGLETTICCIESKVDEAREDAKAMQKNILHLNSKTEDCGPRED